MEPDRKLESFRVLVPKLIKSERAGDSSRYVISTDSYISQDGWVLRSDGMSLHSQVLPIMWNHGYDPNPAMNASMSKGKWIDISAHSSEIVATPQWSSNLTDDESMIQTRSEEGLLMTSVRFVVDDWHAPDPMERAKYNIPENENYAGIATKWRAMEVSFCSIPADGKCGPREMERLYARAQEAHSQAAALGEILEMLKEQKNSIAELRGDFVILQNSFATYTQRVANVKTASASAPPSGAAPQENASRSSFYNKETLGVTSASLDAILARLPNNNKTVKANATALTGGDAAG